MARGVRLLAWLGLLAAAVVAVSTLALALFLAAARVGSQSDGEQP